MLGYTPHSGMPGSKLLHRIQEISQRANFDAIAVAFYDYETSLRFAFQGDRPFKAGVLLGVLKAAEQERLRLDDQLQIRNRFRSIVDGSLYRIERDRDADASVHRAVGGSLLIRDLARAMIVRSSNLATNLLLDLVGVDYVCQILADAGVRGVEVKRGVEDKIAHERGINNEVTAEGLIRLHRLLVDDHFLTDPFRQEGLDILFAQEFKSMLPAKLPKDVKVAHKTGEISTHCHDAGIVFASNRKPYVVSILTEHGPAVIKRNKAVAEISAAIFRYLEVGQPEERPAA
jgi:beta-lactamase class A